MRGLPLGAMAVASSLLTLAPTLAQTPSTQTPAAKTPPAKPAAKPSTTTPSPATRPAPTTPAAPGAALEIKGFRSAAFGMTPAQVKAAITSDFGAGLKMQEALNPADGTQVILIAVDHLDPGPGPAQVGYVFGATSKTLMAVNVFWTTGAEPTTEQRAAIAQAGQQLATYFQSGPAPARAGGPTTLGTNGIMLYNAVDKNNAGVQILLDGMSYQATGGDKSITSPPPKGPATLRVLYVRDVQRPDIKPAAATLKPGSF